MVIIYYFSRLKVRNSSYKTKYGVYDTEVGNPEEPISVEQLSKMKFELPDIKGMKPEFKFESKDTKEVWKFEKSHTGILLETNEDKPYEYYKVTGEKYRLLEGKLPKEFLNNSQDYAAIYKKDSFSIVPKKEISDLDEKNVFKLEVNKKGEIFISEQEGGAVLQDFEEAMKFENSESFNAKILSQDHTLKFTDSDNTSTEHLKSETASGKWADVLGKVMAIGSIGGNVLDHYDPSLATKIENWAPIKWLGNEWDDLADSKFGSDVGSFVDYLANHTYIGSFVGNVLDGVGGFYSGSYKAIADFGESFWDGIVEGNMKAATQDMDNLGTDLHNAVHSIGNAVENTVSDFGSIAKNDWDDIKSWF